MLLLLLGLIGGTAYAAAKGLSAVSTWVPLISVGLALALQKYTASFLSYFVIEFSSIYIVGDRIRIGNIKGDVRHVGLFHTTLEEVGEDEKLGGELTGRILHVPNLLVLDQPVLNYSKDYSTSNKAISSDYQFDEVRLPITTDSNAEKACQILEAILRVQEQPYVDEAGQMFQNGYPHFLAEAKHGPRVVVSVDPQRIWIKGKFVAPVRGRNELRTKLILQFLKEAAAAGDVRLA